MNTALQSLTDIVEPVCRAHGVELVEVRKLTQPGRTVLRVLIDRERGSAEEAGPDGSGVTLADCTAVSRDLSTALDVHEDSVSRGRYDLEVSSPGLERPLVKLSDYTRFAGREVKIQVQAPVEGQRRFAGTLLGVEGESVRIDQDGSVMSIPFGDITKAHLVYRFSR